MKRLLNLTLSFSDGRTQEISALDLPYTFGRKGYCSFGTMKGADVGSVHCRVTSDLDKGVDLETYSGLCVEHLATGTQTIVDGVTLLANEYISLTWNESHHIEIGDYRFELYVEKPRKRMRSGSPPQPGTKSASRGKGRAKTFRPEDDQIVPHSKRKGRTRGHHRR